MQSKKYNTVKTLYETLVEGKRLWDKGRVKKAVQCGWITQEEYKKITGEKYES